MSSKSRSKTSKPTKLWAFWANTHGPASQTPEAVRLHKGLSSYWDKSQNFEVEKEGLVHGNGYLCFAHRDKKEVEKFITGFFACKNLLAGFFEGNRIKPEEPKLYHVCAKDPKHKAWGVYKRPKKSIVTKPFKLEVIVFDYDEALETARNFQTANPKLDINLQGATTSSVFPDCFSP